MDDSISPSSSSEVAHAIAENSPLMGAVVPAVLTVAATAGIMLSAHTLWSRYRMRQSRSCPEFTTMNGDTCSSSGDTGRFGSPPAQRAPQLQGQALRAGPRVSPRPSPSPMGRDNARHVPIAGAGSPKDNAALKSSRSQNRSLRERDQYEKMKEIGRGAFGVVYIGRHIRTGELVAIKEMDVQGADELRTEFEIMRHLNHENIVSVRDFEVGKKHARLYLEWVAGGSLAEILRHRQIDDERLLAAYMRQILEGLAYLHENNVLHRDIKPRNILVDHKGGLKLTDFGLSRHLASMHDKTKCAGTPIYMAPEVMHGRFSVGSDIWALGATMCEMVTGQLPWSHIDPAIFGSQMALMMHIAKFQGERGHHPMIPKTLSPEAVSFMETCFAPLPEDRGSCRELLRHPFLKEEPREEEEEPSQCEETDSTRSSSEGDVLESSGEGVFLRGGGGAVDSPAAPNTVTMSLPPPMTRSQRGAGAFQ